VGDTLGVFTNSEVKELNPDERELLKHHIIQQLQTSEEVHKIIGANPKLLQALTKHPKIRKILRAKARPLKDRLRQE
jgi:hypothetical protein